MDFLNYVINHWSAISAIILFVISTIATVKKLKLSANDSAKEIASRLMFGIEKKVDEYLVSKSGADKFKLVVEDGYDLFTKKTRFFVSKPDFEKIVQGVHDESIKFLEDKIAKNTPVVTPVAPIVAETITGNTSTAQSAIETIVEGLKKLGVNINTDTPVVPAEAQINQPQTLI